MMPRTLVPFDLRSLPVIDTDVLIIGSGSAALRAALAAARHRRSVLVVTKKQRMDCNSFYAQGGIAAAIADHDSPESHILDTMKYADDCQNIFGHFFHHFPYFGMRSSDDAENLKNAFANTEALFWSEFGESLNDLINKFSGSDVLDAAKCKEGNCRSCKNTIGDFVEERPRLSLVR